jgi:glycosyltransferase involved in cell wall biosynthesis
MKVFKRGVDTFAMRPDPGRQKELRQLYDIPDDAPVLLWAGRFGKEKNLDFLVSVFRQISIQCPSCYLVMVGDGPELPRLQAETKNEQAVFPGRIKREELRSFYGMADVFVFPSTTDTFGMVVLEAQACGLPAVVTNVGGPQELVSDGETGFVLPADDPELWVSTVKGIIDTKQSRPEQFAAMRRDAAEMAQKGFGWDSVLDEMMGVETASPVSTRAVESPKPQQREPELSMVS